MINFKKTIPIIISFMFLGTSCNNNIQDSTSTVSTVSTLDETYITESTSVSTQDTTTAEPISKAQEVLDSMSLREKIYQMFVVTPEALNDGEQVLEINDTIKNNLKNQAIGGVILFSDNIDSENQTIELISNLQENSNISLFTCIDEEGGYVARLGNKLDTSQLKSMKYYGENPNEDDAYNIGSTLAQELKKYGFNVDFAPVSDVDLSTSNNALHELNRCFSDDPNIVALMVENVVKGLQDNGVSATLKHFPGLGSSSGDTHEGSVFLTRTKQEFETQDFIPIKAGINANVDFVMVGHIIIDGLSNNLPSDLSSDIVTGWLKNELNFNGIVITDSHSMEAITDNYSSGEASVMAIQSGVDIVLMPENLEQSVNAILSAIDNGEISESRIDESVLKILNQKDKLGIL